MTETTDRPLVTFALLAYNQEAFIREAVAGAFAQTYQPLEIILSDDCSGDRTLEIMREMTQAYNGQHSVRVRSNRFNLGIAEHVNILFEESSGDVIVLAAGDDISFPTRTSSSVDLLQRSPCATAVLLSADTIDELGKISGERIINRRTSEASFQTIKDLLTWRHRTFGASRAVRREVFMQFGPLNEECPTEDTPLLLRSLILGPNILSKEKGILYRRHGKNLGDLKSTRNMNIAAIYRQYARDVDLAESLHLISRNKIKRLKSWIRNDKKLRLLKIKLSSGGKIGLLI